MATTVPMRALNVPGPRARLGGYLDLIELVNDPIRVMGQRFERYGPVASLASDKRVRLFSPLPQAGGVVFVKGPDLVRQVSTQSAVYHRRQMTGPLTPRGEPTARQRSLRYWGSGLFDLNDDEHRRARRLMLPAFHKKRVETYRETTAALTQQLIDRWRAGGLRDLHADFAELTLWIVTRALFGVDPHTVGERIGKTIQQSMATSFSPLTTLLQLDLPGLPYHRFLNQAGKIEREMRQIIAERRAQGGAGDDVLTMLMEARDEDGSAMDEDELLGHATLLFMAGHETSANALSWTLLLLSQHPEVVSDLVDELEAALRGGVPTVEQLRPESEALPLLERVVKESMRLLPAAPWNARVAAQPSELGGYSIPAGTEVLMSIYHTHRLPEIYPEPQCFNPARWEDSDPGIYAYVPFSGGPRMCIGASFAMMEIKLVLAMVLPQFRFELAPAARVDRLVSATLAPRPGVPMTIHRQDRQFTSGVGLARGQVREMVDLP